ncbi:hypothetical protein T492DRAFT_1072011 [Pavlovales sp. CCMP2436]|nr:hypothetical protein T492DRAFT_1072011 [Pavlovales sp. CCMP2436]
MPKRSTHTFESEKDGVQQAASMHSAYCQQCGACCLVADRPLDSLPRRHTDGAYVLDTRAAPADGGRPMFYRLLAKDDEASPVFLRRPAGVEKQWRLNCVKCALLVAYRQSAPLGPGAPLPPLTFLVDRALGPHPSTLDDSAVPKCIQPISLRAVRIAFEVTTGAPMTGITAINDSEVHVHLRAAHMREGAAHELAELAAKALRLPRHKLQLTRGWSFKSKFMLVNGMSRGEVFQRLRNAVDMTDGSYARRASARNTEPIDDEQAGAQHEQGPGPLLSLRGPSDNARQGAVASSIRAQWDTGVDEDADVAERPDKKYKPGW